MSKEKDIWDPKKRRQRKAVAEGLHHLTNTVPGTTISLASLALSMQNAFVAVTELDGSKVLPAATYYAVGLASTLLVYALQKEHENSNS